MSHDQLDRLLADIQLLDQQLGQRRLVIDGVKLRPTEYMKWRAAAIIRKNDLMLRYRKLKREMKGQRDGGPERPATDEA